MKSIASILALVLLAVLPFLGGLHGTYIEDDIGIVRENPHLVGETDFAGIWRDNYWGDIWCGLYRPLTILSYALDGELLGRAGGGAAGPPAVTAVHAGNLALNAAATLLLFWILRRLYGARPHGGLAAWCGAALFAVHPAHVEAVVHMVGRADLLAAFLCLAAWLAHGSPETARGPRPWLGGFLYLGSLLAKESGALLPAVLLVEALWWRPAPGSLGAPLGARLRGQIAPLLPYGFALGAFLVARGLVLGDQMTPQKPFVLYAPGAYVAFAEPRSAEVLWTMTHALGEYLRLLFWPAELSADYSGFPHASGPTRPALVSGLVAAALLGVAWQAARRGRRELLAWAAVFVAFFLPVSNLIVVSGIVMAERALYLPSIALAGLVAALLPSLVARARALVLLPLGLVALGALASARQSALWADPKTLFQATVDEGRFHGHLALTGLADVHLQAMAADPTRRIDLLQETLALARRSVELHRTTVNTAQLAFALELSGDLASALVEWERVEAVDPRRRADVERCVAQVEARAKDAGLLRSAVATSQGAQQRASVAGHAERAAYWASVLERLARLSQF